MEALQAHDSAWRELSEGQAKPRCPTLSIKPVPSPSRCQVPPVVVLPGNDVLLGAVSRRQGHLGTHLGDTTSGLLSEQGQGTVLTCIRLCRCVSRTSSQAFFVPGAFTYSKSAAGAAYSLLWVKYEVITHILVDFIHSYLTNMQYEFILSFLYKPYSFGHYLFIIK